jgi:hypothetical protein
MEIQMSYKSLSALLLVVVASVGWAAAKPNFTGEWQLNLSKSNYGSMPAPTSLLRTITHADPSLEIVDDQNGGRRTGVSTRKYMAGKTTNFEINGAAVEGSAAWEGASLIVTTKVASVGLMFKDKMSLSSDGKQLTSDVQIDSNQGPAHVTLVFDRQ